MSWGEYGLSLARLYIYGQGWAKVGGSGWVRVIRGVLVIYLVGVCV